jgi:hypothetical protein
MNREVRFRGRLDVPLDEVGRAEAWATARSLEGEGIAAVYSSPLGRALEVGVGFGFGRGGVRLRLGCPVEVGVGGPGIRFGRRLGSASVRVGSLVGPFVEPERGFGLEAFRFHQYAPRNDSVDSSNPRITTTATTMRTTRAMRAPGSTTTYR